MTVLIELLPLKVSFVYFSGLWNDTDGFYYDHILSSKPYQSKPLRIKSMVGVISLFGSYLLQKSDLEHHPDLQAYITDNREKLANHVSKLQ